METKLLILDNIDCGNYSCIHCYLPTGECLHPHPDITENGTCYSIDKGETKEVKRNKNINQDSTINQEI